jgi:hypothetical protein
MKGSIVNLILNAIVWGIKRSGLRFCNEEMSRSTIKPYFVERRHCDHSANDASLSF